MVPNSKKLYVFFAFFLIMTNSAVAVELNKTTPKLDTVILTCPDHIFETAEAASGWTVTKFQSNFDHAEFLTQHLYCFYKPNNTPQLIYTSSTANQDCTMINRKFMVDLVVTTDVNDDDFALLNSVITRTLSKTESTNSGTRCYYNTKDEKVMYSSDPFSSCKVTGKRATCKP